ncbi:MAG: hypothetical protein ACFFD1_00080 [Candidatus Thorarchaeota archaeon]
MATTDTTGLIPVPGNDSLFFDPSTSTYMQSNTSDIVPNEWAWGSKGITPLGGLTGTDTTNPYLQILPQYASGAPITANDWQQAAANSLTGFMQTIFNQPQAAPWDPEIMFATGQSGVDPNSQYKFGTLQNLLQDPTLSNFFGDVGQGGVYFTPHQLGIDNPGLAQMGSAAQEWLNSAHNAGINANVPINYNQWQQLSPTAQQFAQSQFGITPPSADTSQFNPLAGLNPLDKLLAFENVPVNSSLEKMIGTLPGFVTSRSDVNNPDYNDYLFQLDINPYTPAAPLTVADPKSVMQQFFNTAPYQLAFGSSPDVLNPNLSPEERFKLDPGYQFAQNEGLRQLQFDQAKSGLLESGRGLRNSLQFSQGLADQNYQRYLSQVLGLFQNYQQGIAGAANTGANAANQQASNLANLGNQLGSNSNQIAALLGQLTGDTGTNIGSLFSNQGAFGSSALLNTGAAQSNNILSGLNVLSQLASAQAAADASKSNATIGSIGSILGGIGKLAGSYIK